MSSPYHSPDSFEVSHRPDSDVLAFLRRTMLAPQRDTDPANDEVSPSAPDGRGNFFAIDRRVWDHVCLLGLNPAVAFLVLARGSGGDNATTSWSVEATEKRTGVSRHRAKAAVELLENAGVLELLKSGSRPQRRIRAAHLIPGCQGYRGVLNEAEAAFCKTLPRSTEMPIPEGFEFLWEIDEDDMTPAQRRVFDRVEEYSWTPEEIELSERVIMKGHAEWQDCSTLVVREPTEADSQPDWIWLPNSLVDGVDGETPPIELIRQSRDLPALSLFIRLYHFSSLIRHGGLDPHLAYQPWTRKLLGERGEWNIWEYQRYPGVGLQAPARLHPWHLLPAHRDREGTPWFDLYCADGGWAGALSRLCKLGLVQAVSFLYEGPDDEAEQVFPAPDSRCSVATPAELELGKAAREAAERLLPNKVEDATADRFCVAVLGHLREPDCRGVFRLRYRPLTRATAQWMTSSDDWERQTQRMTDIAA